LLPRPQSFKREERDCLLLNFERKKEKKPKKGESCRQKKKMSDEGGGGSAAARTRSKARVMQEMDANANNTATGNKPPSSAQTMDKIQSRYVKFNPV